jgi:hypothetical protein
VSVTAADASTMAIGATLHSQPPAAGPADTI